MDAAASYRLIVPYAAALRGEPEMRAQSKTGLAPPQTVRETSRIEKTRRRKEDERQDVPRGDGDERAPDFAPGEASSNGWFLNEDESAASQGEAETLEKLRAYAEEKREPPPPRIQRDV